MKTIKKINKDKHTLIHRRYIGVMGFEKDGFDFSVEKNGKIIHYPFNPMIKVSNCKRNESIKTTTDYTEKEYQEMFNEQISKI